jgi:hypothetical protein
MPTTRFDGLPWFEAIVSQELARYRAAIDKEICEAEQVFLEELDHALRTFQALRQRAASADEIADIDAAMADVCCGFTALRLKERARVWAAAIDALDC